MADLLNSENVKWINEIKEELKASVGKPIIRKEWDVLLSRTEISKYYRLCNCNFKISICLYLP